MTAFSYRRACLPRQKGEAKKQKNKKNSNQKRKK